MSRLLDIVDENDRITGRAPRAEIHKQGLRHREVHVWFVTPGGKILFQNRLSPLVILDATVGGHVELGESYSDSAVKETREETGLNLSKTDLVLLATLCTGETFAELGIINNVFRAFYLYRFAGDIKDLICEPGKGQGFIGVSIEELRAPNSAIKKQHRFNPCLLEPYMLTLYEEMLRRVGG